MSRPIGSAVPAVAQQYADEAAHLRCTRSLLVRAPHVRMLHLSRLDERITAHLDGLSVAGATGREFCVAALAHPGAGEVFAAAHCALESGDASLVETLLVIAEAVPAAQPGLISALGWASAHNVRVLVRTWLASSDSFRRQIGLAACAVHRVDPGAGLATALVNQDRGLRTRAFKTAGQCGRADLLPICLTALSDDDEACRLYAALAALVLGDRDRSIAALQAAAESPGPWQTVALWSILSVIPSAKARGLLKQRADDLAARPGLIRAVGVTGDPQYVPWLLNQMSDPQWARAAGQSLSLIIGLDLVHMEFETLPPEGHIEVPNDNPEDDRVGLDEDDSLPWPDSEKIKDWWAKNSARFQPGTRYFLGAPVTREHCIDVLKNGYQRQRILAAHYLCLLDPGTPLFNTSAPAWRQQKLLATMK